MISSKILPGKPLLHRSHSIFFKELFQEKFLLVYLLRFLERYFRESGMLLKIPATITPFVPPEIFLHWYRNLSWILRIFLHGLLQDSLEFFKVFLEYFRFLFSSIPAKITRGVSSGIFLTLPESTFFQRILHNSSSIFFASWAYFQHYFSVISGMPLVFFWDCPEVLFSNSSSKDSTKKFFMIFARMSWEMEGSFLTC